MPLPNKKKKIPAFKDSSLHVGALTLVASIIQLTILKVFSKQTTLEFIIKISAVFLMVYIGVVSQQSSRIEGRDIHLVLADIGKHGV